MTHLQKNLLILMLVVIIVNVACVPVELPVNTVRNDILLVGDSNCDNYLIPYNDRYWIKADISNNCKWGRTLTEINSLPSNNVQLVFIALGVNDANNGVSVESYGNHLTNLLDTTSADVYGILPVTKVGFNIFDIAPYQNEMINRCTNVINPQEYGVVPELLDGVHWSVNDNSRFTSIIKSVISLYPKL